MLCPMKFTATAYAVVKRLADGNDYPETTSSIDDCEKEKCAWWVENNGAGSCVILEIGSTLNDLILRTYNIEITDGD